MQISHDHGKLFYPPFNCQTLITESMIKNFLQQIWNKFIIFPSKHEIWEQNSKIDYFCIYVKHFVKDMNEEISWSIWSYRKLFYLPLKWGLTLIIENIQSGKKKQQNLQFCIWKTLQVTLYTLIPDCPLFSTCKTDRICMHIQWCGRVT